MKKITLTIPKKDEMFMMRYGTGGAPTKRRDAKLIFKRAEKRILSLAGKVKTAIVVKEDGLVINESLASKNPKYLLWLTSAFLEDYLPKQFLKDKEKLYVGNEP